MFAVKQTDMEEIMEIIRKEWQELSAPTLEARMAGDVRFSSPTIPLDLVGKFEVISFLNRNFEILRSHEAKVETQGIPGCTDGFRVVNQFVQLRPETCYMIDSYGIALVTALEPRNVKMEITVTIRMDGQEICEITTRRDKLEIS
jgi:hypothetical protein